MQTIGEKKNKNISYRPNHVDRRRRYCGTAQVAPERRPLSAGGPRLVLSYLHVIILNKVRNISKRNINENLKRKSLNKLVSRFHQNLNTIIK
jgi:hypothetical protein